MRFPWQKKRVGKADKLSREVLITLNKAKEPLNVSQIASRNAALSGGTVLYCLKPLVDYGYVTSSFSKWSKLAAAADKSSFIITPAGRELLKNWDKYKSKFEES